MMASTFKGLDLFGSGPHRFRMLRRGQLVVSEFALGMLSPGSLYLGLVEEMVEIRGRLAASSESALWTLRDAVLAQVLHPPSPGTLVDHSGRSYADMSFVRFEHGDRTDRGRAVSIEYTALFVDFREYPQGSADA